MTLPVIKPQSGVSSYQQTWGNNSNASRVAILSRLGMSLTEIPSALDSSRGAQMTEKVRVPRSIPLSVLEGIRIRETLTGSPRVPLTLTLTPKHITIVHSGTDEKRNNEPDIFDQKGRKRFTKVNIEELKQRARLINRSARLQNAEFDPPKYEKFETFIFKPHKPINIHLSIQNIADNYPSHPVLVTDADDKIIFINEIFQKLLSMTEETKQRMLKVKKGDLVILEKLPKEKTFRYNVKEGKCKFFIYEIILREN